MRTFSLRAISGIVLFFGGLICFVFPMMGAMDVEAMLGIIILLSGIFHLVGAVEERAAIDFIWNMMTSFAFLGFGLFLLADPYEGLQLMSVILFLFLISNGVFILGAAFAQKTYHSKWFWTLASSLLSFVMAAIIFYGYFADDQLTIGVLTGVAILGYGISLLVTSGVIEIEAKPKAKMKK